MIAKISHIQNIEALTNYQFKKIDEGVGFLLSSEKVDDRSKGHSNFSFRSQTQIKNNAENPYVHITLNFPEQDKEKLSDEKFIELGKELLQRMGYAEQPNMIFKHTDQAHPHIHIITHSITEEGTVVSRHFERYRIMEACRQMEVKHGFTIVSSIAEDRVSKIQEIDNDKSYFNYLKSEVQFAMSLKPKRIGDLEAYLTSSNIAMNVSIRPNNAKGASFALTSNTGERYVNNVGTIAIAGSRLSSNLSYNKIRDRVKENYSTAPKRYRYSLLLTNRLNDGLYYFDSIKAEEFEKINNGEYKIISNDKHQFLIDYKGKNIFRDSDLKEFKFSKLGESNIININKDDDKHQSLKTKFLRESIEVYRRASTNLKTSYFLEEIFIKENLFDFLKEGRTFEFYNQYLTLEQLEKIHEYFENISVDTLVKKYREEEKKIVDTFTQTYNDFVVDNNLVSKSIFQDKRRNDFSATLSVQLINMINREILKEAKEFEKLEKLPFYSINTQHYFQSLNYFSGSELKEDSKKHYEKLVNNSFVKELFTEVAKTSFESKDFVDRLNKFGVKVERNRAQLIAKLNEFDTGLRIDQVKDFVLDKDIENQEVETNFEVIQVRHYVLSENWYMVSQNIELLTEIEQKEVLSNQGYIEFIEHREKTQSIENVLYEYTREHEIDYRSDTLKLIQTNTSEFIDKVLEDEVTQKLGVTKEFIEEYINPIITDEAIDNQETREEDRIKADIELVSKYENKEMILALMGYRNNGSDITEKGEKYFVSSDITISSKFISIVENEPTLLYGNSLFKSMIRDIEADKVGGLNPNKMFLVKDALDYLGQDKEVFLNHSTQNYINYYIEASKELPKAEQLEYLNTKGIEIHQDSKGNQKAVFLAYDNIEVNLETKVEITHDQKQAFEIHGYLNTDSFWLNMEIQNNLEKGNYTYAAYLVDRYDVDVWLSDSDRDKHLKELEKEIDKRSFDKSSYTLLNAFRALLREDPEQQADKFNKRRRRRGRKNRNNGRGI